MALSERIRCVAADQRVQSKKLDAGLLDSWGDEAAALEAEIARLRLLVGETPDSEIAAAVEIVEAFTNDTAGCNCLADDERAALNRLINRATGVTVKRLQMQIFDSESAAGCLKAENETLRGALELANIQIATLKNPPMEYGTMSSTPESTYEMPTETTPAVAASPAMRNHAEDAGHDAADPDISGKSLEADEYAAREIQAP